MLQISRWPGPGKGVPHLPQVRDPQWWYVRWKNTTNSQNFHRRMSCVFRLPHNAYRQLNSFRHARSCLSSYLPLTLNLQPEWSGSWVRRREISRDTRKKFSDSSIPSATFPSEWFRVWARFFLFLSLLYLAVPQRRNKPKIFLPDKMTRKKKSEKEKLHSKPSHDFIPERGRADGVYKTIVKKKTDNQKHSVTCQRHRRIYSLNIRSSRMSLIILRKTCPSSW